MPLCYKVIYNLGGMKNEKTSYIQWGVKMVIDTFNVKNQYMIETKQEIIFQSYQSIMFTYNKKEKVLYFNTCEDNYTKTTCKYMGLALQMLCDKIWNQINTNKIYNILYSNNRKKEILSLSKGVLILYD